MKMARRLPEAILGAAMSQIRALRGSSEIESGSTSPKTMISLPLQLSRMKNAELSTVACAFSFTLGATSRGDRAGE